MKHRLSIILFFAFFFFLSGIKQNLMSQVSEQDSLALVALYDSTDGAGWTTKTNWLSGPVSEWYGITVSEGRVTEVFLDANNLIGIIPSEIGDLTNLNILELYDNQLTGDIPDEIYNLTNLVSLRLGSNELEGSISSLLGNLTKLTTLHLSDNFLTGPIPAEIENLENLITLHLRFNQLSGEIPIAVYSLTNLVTLNLSVNELEGTIPPQIENLVNIREFSVPVNNMHGIIPDEIGNLENLRYLWLVANEFEGPIPDGIGQMPALLYLRIENNQFTHLPDISADTSLYDTQIQGNRFTFEDIEPNAGIDGIIYTPQDSVGEKQEITISQDSSLVLTVSVDGTANKYQWKKDGIIVEEATDSSYIIVGATTADEGTYICEITNTIATELTLYSRTIKVTVPGVSAIENQTIQIHKVFSLNQNYPNPFNPKTTINYDLPTTDIIDISIYNILGKKVATIVSKKQSAGSHQVSWNASGFSSGIYYYILTTSSGLVQTRKMILLK